MTMEIERVELIHEAGQATSYNEVSRVLNDHGFTVLDYDTTYERFTVKYNKCDTDLTISFIDGLARSAYKTYYAISFLNLYNGGIIVNIGFGRYSPSFAYIAPESDGDTWVVIKADDYDAIIRTWMKDDEDEGYRDMYDDIQPFPTTDSLQLVNYFNFEKQKLYGNIYICKKLPIFRTCYRYYFAGDISNPNMPEEVFTETPYYLLEREHQHWNSFIGNTNATWLFGPRIKIDEKIFIIYFMPWWDYGNNSYWNPGPDSILPKGYRNVPFAIRVS